MNDQSAQVQRNAAVCLSGLIAELPGTFVGDTNFEPDKHPAAWYAAAEAVAAPENGRQTVKLTLYARTAARLDRDQAELIALSARLAAAAGTAEFRDALAPLCAVVPQEETYELDEMFHTRSLNYHVFIRE